MNTRLKTDTLRSFYKDLLNDENERIKTETRKLQALSLEDLKKLKGGKKAPQE